MGIVPKPCALAFSRFGLGARPGDLAKIGADARDFFASEVRQRAVAQPAGRDLVGTPAALALLREESQRIGAARASRPLAAAPKANISAAPMASSTSEAGAQGLNATPSPAIGAGLVEAPATLATQQRPAPQRLYRAEAEARLQVALEADGGFVERLVWFWSNHFAVSAAKAQQTRATVGAFEREAIRPHVLGRFSDMLLAVEQHPTMLFYFDNQLSIGPNSPAGKTRNRGLNENLAREILELHTLGLEGGYAQKDVTQLARILTGWTIVGPEGRLGHPGSFVFNVNWHEPGDHALLGKTYANHGPEQGRDALYDLARHPATARFIGTKLARHFVADEPPPHLVERIARVFRDTGGDLAEVSLALLHAPEAWTPEARKIRSPHEFLVAAFRLMGANGGELNQMLGALKALGQPLWTPPGPNGYPDTVDHWASPVGLKTRLDIAARIGKRAEEFDPVAALDAALGPLLSSETRQAVARAESRAQGLALALMSPEFQRR